MIIRDLKLDILMGNQSPIIDKFNEITKDLRVIKTDVYNDEGQEFIFYDQNNKWIFYQDLRNGYFWCNYDFYWSIFESEFKLEYEEIQDITKYLVEETLKLKVDTPKYNKIKRRNRVEETLKLKVDTPQDQMCLHQQLVEEVLKTKLK